MQYWIDTGDKKHGPFNARQLKKLALKGELKRSHKISTDQKRWVAAESVKGLKFKADQFKADQFKAEQIKPSELPSSSDEDLVNPTPSSEPSAREPAESDQTTSDRKAPSQSLSTEPTPVLADTSTVTTGHRKKDVHPLLCMLVSGVVLVVIWSILSFFFPQSSAEKQLADDDIPMSLRLILLPFFSIAMYTLFELLKRYAGIFVIGQIFSVGTAQLFVWLGGAVLLVAGRWPRTTVSDMFDAWKSAGLETPEGDTIEPAKRDSDAESIAEAKLYAGFAVVGWSLFGALSVLAMWVGPQGPHIQEAVALPDWREAEWSEFVDSKKRFVCDVPPGWEVEESQEGPESNATFTFGPHRIAVTVRDTEYHEMYAGIEQEMVEGLKKSALSMGPDGKVGLVNWTTLMGSRALQIDLGSALNERYARTIKAKHDGWDFFIGVYVEPSSESKELCDLFAEFLLRYGEKPRFFYELAGGLDTSGFKGYSNDPFGIVSSAIQQLGDIDRLAEVAEGLRYIAEEDPNPAYATMLSDFVSSTEPEILIPSIHIFARHPEETKHFYSRIAAHANHEHRLVREAVVLAFDRLATTDPASIEAIMKQFDSIERKQAVLVQGSLLHDPDSREKALGELFNLRGGDISDELIASQLYGMLRSLNENPRSTTDAAATSAFESQVDKSLTKLGFGSDQRDSLRQIRQRETLEWLPADWDMRKTIGPDDAFDFDSSDGKSCLSTNGDFLAIWEESTDTLSVFNLFPEDPKINWKQMWRTNRTYFESAELRFVEYVEPEMTPSQRRESRYLIVRLLPGPGRIRVLHDAHQIHGDGRSGDSGFGNELWTATKSPHMTVLKMEPQGFSFPAFHGSRQLRFTAPSGVKLTTGVVAPNNHFVVAGDDSGKLYFVNTTDALLERAIEVTGEPIESIIISADGATVLAFHNATIEVIRRVRKGDE